MRVINYVRAKVDGKSVPPTLTLSFSLDWRPCAGRDGRGGVVKNNDIQISNGANRSPSEGRRSATRPPVRVALCPPPPPPSDTILEKSPLRTTLCVKTVKKTRDEKTCPPADDDDRVSNGGGRPRVVVAVTTTTTTGLPPPTREDSCPAVITPSSPVTLSATSTRRFIACVRARAVERRAGRCWRRYVLHTDTRRPGRRAYRSRTPYSRRPVPGVHPEIGGKERKKEKKSKSTVSFSSPTSNGRADRVRGDTVRSRGTAYAEAVLTAGRFFASPTNRPMSSLPAAVYRLDQGLV